MLKLRKCKCILWMTQRLKTSRRCIKTSKRMYLKIKRIREIEKNRKRKKRGEPERNKKDKQKSRKPEGRSNLEYRPKINASGRGRTRRDRKKLTRRGEKRNRKRQKSNLNSNAFQSSHKNDKESHSTITNGLKSLQMRKLHLNQSSSKPLPLSKTLINWSEHGTQCAGITASHWI